AMASLLLFLLPFFILPFASTLEFRYHNNLEIEQYLLQINASNPDITHLYSIGQSVRGQQLWVLALGLSPRRHTVGIPEFKYVANMHGNEVLGRVLLLHLIDDLVRGYRAKETWFNYNGIDLNRNFPDAFAGLRRQDQLAEEKREAEVRAVIGWLRTETFVLSANLHGGALVASYPYDNSNGGSEQVGGASVAPDDDVFVHLAKVYSYGHATMHKGGSCDDTRPFLEGITNGYLWYPLIGQHDTSHTYRSFNNDVQVIFLERLEWKPAEDETGVKGRVLDGSGVPVQDAVVEVRGRRNICPFRSDRHGEYYRLLLPGNYTFTVTYPGHEVLTEMLNIPDSSDQFSAMKHDFLLRRITTTTGRSLFGPTQAPPSPSCNYTLNLEGGGAISGPSQTGLLVGLGLAAALRSLID
ncbi:hypothetical protein L3Q82_009260, partial [Scortum barcoo]